MRHELIAVVTASAMLLCGVATAEGVTARIVLKPVSEVAARDYTLGEVATVQCDDGDIAAALNELRVGHLGLLSAPTRVARGDLERYVMSHRPLGLLGVQWAGAETASVQMRSLRLEPDVLYAKAAEALQAALAPHYASVSLRPVSRIDVLRLPMGEVTLVARLPREEGGAPRASRRMRVEVDVLQQRELLRTVALGFEVHALAPAWTARSELSAGRAVTQDDLERRDVDVTGLAGAPMADPAQLAGSRLRRPLHAGDPLSLSLLEPVPAVSRGDAVTLQTKSGAVTIESHGVAMADGVAGRDVPVKLDNAQLVRARVVGPRLLELEGGR